MLACSAWATPAARRSSGWRARAMPAPSSSRPACALPASTSRSPASRPRCSTGSVISASREAERRRADLAASYQRAIVEALTIRVRRALRQTGLRRLAIGGGVAANGPLRERLARTRRRARRAPTVAVHRQRGDDRQRRALGAASCHSRGTWSSTCTRRGERAAGRLMHTVTIYGRPGCCLCDDALVILQRVRRAPAVRARAT